MSNAPSTILGTLRWMFRVRANRSRHANCLNSFRFGARFTTLCWESTKRHGRPRKKFTSDGRLSGIALVLGLLVLWEASVRLGWVNTPTWPAVTTVFRTFWDELIERRLFEHVRAES